MIPDASIAPNTGQGPETTSHWLDSLPADAVYEFDDGRGAKPMPLREHPKLRQFRGPADLARSYLEAQRLIGKKSVGLVRPAEDAPDQDKTAFERELRAMLGVPESPDGYDLVLPGDTEPHERLMPWFRQAAHDLGLSPDQAAGLVEGYHSLVDEMADEARRFEEVEAEVDRRRALESLRATWGERLPERAENARRGFMAVADQAGITDAEAKAFMDRHGDDPVVLRMFNLVGNAFCEDGLVTGAASPAAPGPMSMEDFYRTVVFRNR